MSIDFSKAPDGATHYYLRRAGFASWYREGDSAPLCHDPDDGCWFPSEEFINLGELTPIPFFEPLVSIEDAQPATTGSKHDSGKPVMGAVPPNALLAVARVLTFGAEKYGRDNWQKVENMEVRYLDATLRHINAYQRGETVDPESGESHLAHAVCSLMFMLETQEGK